MLEMNKAKIYQQGIQLKELQKTHRKEKERNTNGNKREQ